MTRDNLLRELLDRGWTEADLRQAAQWLSRIENDPETLAVLRQYDRVRSALQPDNTTRQAEPAGGWEAMEERLRAALARAADGSQPPSHPGSLSGSRQRHGPAGAGLPFPFRGFGPAFLAACLVLAGGFGGWFLHRAPQDNAKQPVAQGPTTNGAAIPSPREVSEQVQAFREVSQVLDNQAAWVSLSDRGSDVGVAETPVSADQRLLLLRLSVHRDNALVSRSDLVIVPGHSADLRVPLENGKTLRYVISVTAETIPTFSLWAELSAPNAAAQTLAALATQLRTAPGKVRSAGELVAGSDEYQVKVGFSEPARSTHDGSTPAPKDHL